ncbi:collagen alpha-1(I) chain-like [Achroia grisella]|uniref:collagen alpha-1(I) chain-like n=1 Tax=Achroia grisella TaxID=688607 RepID=UPI0027D21D85|nr:collagen alpha-1(I) chain-like [Achroia grisella]
MHIDGAWWLVLACICACSAEKWRFPEGAASVRIDTKVRFVDGDDRPDNSDKMNTSENQVQADEIPFEPASNTVGFYNRPVNGDISGRYPVRVEPNRASAPYSIEGQTHYSITKNPQQYYSDGTLDSMQHCKCVSTPHCRPSSDSLKACGVGKYLCCYKRSNKNYQQNSEYFNEVEDERPVLLPGQNDLAGPFPPSPGTYFNGIFGAEQDRNPSGIGNDRPRAPAVLVGPGGPTGNIGPPRLPVGNANSQNPQIPPVLVGPDGPSGIIGPGPIPNRNPDENRDVGNSESAQRGILVGPGGPTGIIGPAGFNRRPGGFMNNYFYGGGRGSGPGVLVGPGGPTGIIGPGRGILVGPGGPTGQIGPRRPFYYGCPRRYSKSTSTTASSSDSDRNRKNKKHML